MAVGLGRCDWLLDLDSKAQISIQAVSNSSVEKGPLLRSWNLLWRTVVDVSCDIEEEVEFGPS